MKNSVAISNCGGRFMPLDLSRINWLVDGVASVGDDILIKCVDYPDLDLFQRWTRTESLVGCLPKLGYS